MPGDLSAEEEKWIEELVVQPDLDSAHIFSAKHPSLIHKNTEFLMTAVAARQPDRADRERLDALATLVP